QCVNSGKRVMPGRRSGAEASPESILPDLWLWFPVLGLRPSPGITGLPGTRLDGLSCPTAAPTSRDETGLFLVSETSLKLLLRGKHQLQRYRETSAAMPAERPAAGDRWRSVGGLSRATGEPRNR